MGKRVIAVLLILVMSFSLAACGVMGDSGTDKTQESTTKSEGKGDAWQDEAGGGETSGDKNGKYTIGVVIHTTTDFLCSKLKSYTDYMGKENDDISRMKPICLQLRIFAPKALTELSQRTFQVLPYFRD